jgi:hypothetical protein
LIAAETGSKTIAAMHSQCRSWVKGDLMALICDFRSAPNNGRRQTGLACLKVPRTDMAAQKYGLQKRKRDAIRFP